MLSAHPPQVEAAFGPRSSAVIGVLVENAKTTRRAVSLTLNALVNGCNQEDATAIPHMAVQIEDVEEAIVAAAGRRRAGRVSGSGRVSKIGT